MFEDVALVLVYLNPDRTDKVGNVYPESGKIKCDNFEHNKKVNEGLYGILWGQNPKSSWIPQQDDLIWSVVETPVTNDLFFLDRAQDIVKFKRGEVVANGSLSECIEYIEASGLKREVLGKKIGEQDPIPERHAKDLADLL